MMANVSARSALTRGNSFARSNAAIGTGGSLGQKRSGWRWLGCGRGMLVSFATGLVAQQALPGIELEAEFAETRQRETRDLPHHHRRRPILGHPDRHLRQRAVRLADGQSDFVATTITPRNNDRFPTTGMKAVTDSRPTNRMPGISFLLRPPPVPSSGPAPPRPVEPRPRAGGRA